MLAPNMSSKQVVIRPCVALAIAWVGLSSCVVPGDEEPYSELEQFVLGPPANVMVTPTAIDRATVSWDPVVGAVKYYVSRSTTGPAGPFSFLNTTRAPGTTLQVAHLSASTEYCYEVRTEDGTGPGAPS